MLSYLLGRSPIPLEYKVAVPMEERRTRWTTYSNISIWFDKWEYDLKDLGFATDNEGGGINIPLNQLQRIINIDETALSLDGAAGRCGGRPSVLLTDPLLQASFTRTSKSSITVTMITGSSAAGEPIAPHFQFPTRAKENPKFNIEIARWLKKVRGKFGEDRYWGSTIGMNEKGGMNTEEFEKYVLQT